MAFICLSLVISDIENLFICLSVTCVSPLEKCLFKTLPSFYCFWWGFFGLFLRYAVEGASCIFWIVTPFQVYGFHKEQFFTLFIVSLMNSV